MIGKMEHFIELIPRDVLFFRDGKSLDSPDMGTAEVCEGARWPTPNILHSAVMSLLHRAFSKEDLVCKNWAKAHQHWDDEKKKKTTHAIFGGVKTLGLFPQEDGKIYFPVPADLQPGANNTILKLAPFNLENISRDVKNNLPEPLKYVVGIAADPSKEKLGAWISSEGLNKYLTGDLNLKYELCGNDKFFDTENRCGIVIDSKTGTVAGGKFYMAAYMRLKNGVTMAGRLSAVSVGGCGKVDLWENLTSDRNRRMILGGQRGAVGIKPSKKSFDFGKPEITGTLVKWILLSPAYFKAGWRPGFVNEDGKVNLKKPVEKRGDETRAQWRERIKDAETIDAKLVAARINKPIPLSGWKINAEDKDADEGGGAAKATKLLVPAGSVYYFECGGEDEAKKLAEALHNKTHSDELGEQGFGFGVCSTWEFNNLTKTNNQ